ncbi:HD domain-containing protein [Archaeoglobus veneficus]|uniref:Metal dependent phosphohydrolase n=1 Tax=Archaeoglobus veneficus (strain DSM 11195 / SNP6) TaxID=693661 RepID=F2KMV1_ARCVS|nr:HD domain-containing protein [Archaeoglobus veneficus]AEA46125.1 metal dependent phosphohydrolase [Archaeoglobus veneficus SNP6]
MEIRDPIHGFIHLNDAEKELINTEPFQRLRNIKQLGLTCYLYPGATHTRFEHSLGVMHVATQIVRSILNKHKVEDLAEYLGLANPGHLKDRLETTTRLAALFHDLGHPPFSHSSENLLKKEHEEYSAEIIETYYNELLRPFDRTVSVEDLSFLITKGKKANGILGGDPLLSLIQEIISGEIDADRMDYLLRDSHYTGVAYGNFDYGRIVETLTITPKLERETDGESADGLTKIFGDELISEVKKSPIKMEPRIGVEVGGIYVVEQLLIARYFMFNQVYFHPIRRCYDSLLGRYLSRAFPEGYPEDLEKYLDLDDVYVMNLIKNDVKSKKVEDTERKKLAESIYRREHPRLVFEYNVDLTKDQFNEVCERMTGALAEKFSLNENTDIIVDRAEKSITKIQQSDFLVIADEISKDLNKYWSIEKMRKLWESREVKLKHVYQVSDLIKMLVQSVKKINKLRVYARVGKGDVDDAWSLCSRIVSEIRCGV